MHCGVTAQLLSDTLEADLCSISCWSYVLLLDDLLQKMHKTFILRDAVRIVIDASQISAWHSPNPAREVGSSVWHPQPLKMLRCPQGWWEQSWGSQISISIEELRVFMSGRRHRGKASLCSFPVSSAVLAPIHRQLLIQHSWLEDHFSSYIICQPRGSKKKKESRVMKLNPRK